MERVLEISTVLIICGTFILLVWLLKSLLVTPVPTDDDTSLYMMIAVKGDGSRLEQTLQSLTWLKEEGKIPMELVIVNCGLDGNGYRMTELIASQWGITCCEPESLDRLIGDIKWRKELTESEVR